MDATERSQQLWLWPLTLHLLSQQGFCWFLVRQETGEFIDALCGGSLSPKGSSSLARASAWSLPGQLQGSWRVTEETQELQC